MKINSHTNSSQHDSLLPVSQKCYTTYEGIPKASKPTSRTENYKYSFVSLGAVVSLFAAIILCVPSQYVFTAVTNNLPFSNE
jgi:hypothetical protein